jgi:hypothetical protein
VFLKLKWKIMPLPSFNSFRKVWVEKTKASHGHGGAGWEFGTCLWSPSASKSGIRIYENMSKVQPEDLVLHFYEDAPYGRDEDHYFCGASIIDSNVQTVSEEPPHAGVWAGQGKYYRIELRDFTAFDGVPLRMFAQENSDAIIRTLKNQQDSPFINYPSGTRLAQGKYLSQCGLELYELLSRSVDEPILLAPKPSKPALTPAKRQSTQPFDYEDYVEGQRAKREAWFFSRNPKLVRDAKERYNYQCQACLFRFDDMYPELGNGFIEIHHLNPLSERRNASADHRLTELSQVTALCANCHRMIHRLIRKVGGRVSIDDLRTRINARLPH